MEITEGLVEHIAALARLDLSRSEREAMRGDLVRILEYMAQLDELNTDSVEPTAQVAATGAPLREDEPAPSLPREIALGSAPRQADGAFVVPPVIGDGIEHA